MCQDSKMCVKVCAKAFLSWHTFVRKAGNRVFEFAMLSVTGDLKFKSPP